MEPIRPQDMQVLGNPGVQSTQLLNPANSQCQRITLTRVVVQPGAGQGRHTHDASEQIWVALQGRGTLLLAAGAPRRLRRGRWPASRRGRFTVSLTIPASPLNTCR